MAGGARICLGQIGAAHGVRGEVRLYSFTADPEAIAGYGPLETEDGRVVRIESLRRAKDHFVAQLAGVSDRGAAEQLTNIKLYVLRERLPAPDQPDEFYHADLIGLTAVDRPGDTHRTADDTPAGGGPGMVMKADFLGRAIDATATDTRPRLLMSPRGTPLTQARIEALTGDAGVVMVCGRFEGVDERIIAARGLEEVSAGDYVLSGGEIAAMALIDACVRLLPRVMGTAAP